MAGILVIAEHLRGALSPATGEIIGLARTLKGRIGGPVTVALISDRPQDLAAGLALEGVDEVLLVTAPSSHFDAATYEEAACRIAADLMPRLILIGHGVNGMSYGPSVAVRLGGGFVSDAIGLDASSGPLTVTRGGYGNKVLTTLTLASGALATVMVRGGSAKAPAPVQAVSMRDYAVDFSGIADLTSQHVDYLDPPPSDIDINKAEFILSIGRGIQDEKNIERFRMLAERLGATLGCSRPLADAGWLPKAHQVGLSGKMAQNCKLYIALGISGAVQHLHGMKHVETIIAINTDRNAPIYNVATYGACLDVFEFADALERTCN
ncbi:MAG TPA: electron transfer flavoprotein subunit alpha/FixB family protein [Azospirillum sp.]|nr:electron transfer flavoprotein subunit alpha/FixB family protein [Azospirillum sp.]